MADRPLGIENMAVSSDSSVSQHSFKDNGKEEIEHKGNQSNPKADAPKKKTTFKITSVTKNPSQRGGSGDLTQDNDIDSQDDLDETVDSHTEDLSSDIYDTNSKATDIDNQDPLLTPEEMVREKLMPEEIAKKLSPEDVVKETKPARFKVVKIETREPFRRGRWVCYDYLDAPEKVETKQEEIHVNSGNSSAANSVHYVHGVDDPSKNPLLAGATGTLPTQPLGDGTSIKTQGELFQPIQTAPSSQPGTTLVNQVNASFSNHVAQSSVPHPYVVQAGMPGQSIGQSVSVNSNHSLRSGGSIPNLPPTQLSQTNTSPSLSGNISYPSGQPLPVPAQQGSTIPANVHSQSACVPGSVSTSQQTPPAAMQTGEFMDSAALGQRKAAQGQQGVPHQQQQAMYDMTSQQPSTFNSSGGAVNNAAGNMMSQHNHLSSNVAGQHADGFVSDHDLQSSLSGTLISHLTERVDEQATANLGAGLAEIAVGGIGNMQTSDNDITEETGSSTVAIDNKIEQAMDLVKSHLMYAVREEVEVLKEQIKELMERIRTMEFENKVLRSEASPETLAKLPPAPPPISNPLLQQLMTPAPQQPPSSSST